MRHNKFLNVTISIVTCTLLIASLFFTYPNTLSTVYAEDYIEVYRLYNPNTGEHFYTTSTVENNMLQQLISLQIPIHMVNSTIQ